MVTTNYSPSHVANSILAKHFYYDTPINSMRLQRVLFILSSEYMKKTGKMLFTEPFETWSYGPVVTSIHNYYIPLKGSPIKNYIYSAKKKKYVVNEEDNPVFSEVLHQVFHAAKHHDAIGLTHILRLPGSPWDNAYQNDSRLISNEDIMEWNCYRPVLGMTQEV